MPTILDAPESERTKLYAYVIILTALGWTIFRLWYAVIYGIFVRTVPKRHNIPPLWMEAILAIVFTILLISASIFIGVSPF